MADILIKGMKMPKDCPQCPLSHWNKLDQLTGCELVWRYVPESEADYWQSSSRPQWCPLVELPPEKNRLYVCDPSKADGCSKTGCALTGEEKLGDCMLTTRLEWALMEVQTDGKL